MSSAKRVGDPATSSSSRKQPSVASFFQPASKKGRKEEYAGAAPSADAAAPRHKIYCDLDGVLVDFDAGVSRLLGGKRPDQVPPHRLWSAVRSAHHFYRDLPWMPDGEELWDALRSAIPPPTILTGVPHRGGTDVRDKYAWCQRELNVETHLVDMTGPPGSGKKHLPSSSANSKPKPGVVNVVTCWSRNKHCESKPGHVLVDDREKLRDDWEKAGGTFVLHTDAASTLQKLRRLGVVLSPPVPSGEESTDMAPTPSDKERGSASTTSSTAVATETASSSADAQNDDADR